MKTILKAGLFALTAGFASAAYAGEVVIMDSSTDALMAGDMVPDTQSVNIPGGAVVTLIMADGETRIVNGPYEGPIGEARSSEEALETLTASRGSETKVLGAVRAPKWDTSE